MTDWLHIINYVFDLYFSCNGKCEMNDISTQTSQLFKAQSVSLNLKALPWSLVYKKVFDVVLSIWSVLEVKGGEKKIGSGSFQYRDSESHSDIISALEALDQFYFFTSFYWNLLLMKRVSPTVRPVYLYISQYNLFILLFIFQRRLEKPTSFWPLEIFVPFLNALLMEQGRLNPCADLL